jgi:quercetin 2,3-dioxygenase
MHPAPMNPSSPTLATLAAVPIRRSRRVEQRVVGQATSDGDGVRLTRILTQPHQRRLDPFLMLDAFGSDRAGDYIGGFPDHPHRGFETVTVMLAGRMRHADSVGNRGLLEPGSIQWMTAGRGLIHSEMPEQTEGRMAGFQLWINLAAADKMQPPAYRDMPPSAVPRLQIASAEPPHAAVTVRLLAGEQHGVAGAVRRPVTEPLLLDVTIPPGARFDAVIPATHNAFVHVFAEPGVGSPVNIGPAGGAAARIAIDRMAILANDPVADGVSIHTPADATQPARVLVAAARPLGEPVVQYGPFVMNTVAQIHEAIADFQAGRLHTPAHAPSASR